MADDDLYFTPGNGDPSPVRPSLDGIRVARAYLDRGRRPARVQSLSKSRLARTDPPRAIGKPRAVAPTPEEFFSGSRCVRAQRRPRSLVSTLVLVDGVQHDSVEWILGRPLDPPVVREGEERSAPAAGAGVDQGVQPLLGHQVEERRGRDEVRPGDFRQSFGSEVALNRAQLDVVARRLDVGEQRCIVVDERPSLLAS